MDGAVIGFAIDDPTVADDDMLEQIEVLATPAALAANEEVFTALDGDGSALNTGTAGNNQMVTAQVNALIAGGLTGIGVGEETNQRSNQNVTNNAEIQYNPANNDGINGSDKFFIDFNRLTSDISVDVSLFFSQERVSWGPHYIAAEQLGYQLLRELPTITGSDVTIAGNHYEFVSGATPTIVPATGTGRWTGSTNPGEDSVHIQSDEVFDVLILSGADYSVPTPTPAPVGSTDVSDYLLSGIALNPEDLSTPQKLTCFGGSNDIGQWGNANIAYSILGAPFVQVNTDYQESVVDPIELTAIDSSGNPVTDSDLAAVTNLPSGATGLGVGEVQQDGNTNDPVANNPEIQGANGALIGGDDALRINFGLEANFARVQLSLFYALENHDNDWSTPSLPEQMTYELYNGVTALPGGPVLVTAAGTGTYSPSNAGEYTFTVGSTATFDTIVFSGADYGGGYVAGSNTTDVSDYLLKQVCLTPGTWGEQLNATTGPDNYIYNTVGDGGDTITGFNPTQDAISINRAGFELATDAGDLFESIQCLKASKVQNHLIPS